MKDFRNCIVIAGIWAVFRSMCYWGGGDNIVLSNIILYCSLSLDEVLPIYLINITLDMMPFFLFQMLFGTLLYRHFCVASIYYFSRCTAKVPWFLRETGKLLLLAAIYSTVIPVIVIGIASIRNHLIIDEAGIFLFFYLIILQSLWLFILTLIENLSAIKLGSQNGFLILAVIQMLLIALLILWDKVLPLENSVQITRNAFLVKWNPIVHLFLNWHSSQYTPLDSVIHRFSFSFDLNLSVLVFLILSSLVLAVGCVIIKQHDLISTNIETETV